MIFLYLGFPEAVVSTQVCDVFAKNIPLKNIWLNFKIIHYFNTKNYFNKVQEMFLWILILWKIIILLGSYVIYLISYLSMLLWYSASNRSSRWKYIYGPWILSNNASILIYFLSFVVYIRFIKLKFILVIKSLRIKTLSEIFYKLDLFLVRYVF